MTNTKLVILAHNIRSTFNVGALFRTADCLGVDEIVFSGYTPHPVRPDDDRLPHIAKKIDKQISKTALGAEKTVKWQFVKDPQLTINEFKDKDFFIVALEQAKNSIDLRHFKPPKRCLLIIGEEVDGIDKELLDNADKIVEIPMKGQKESLNVVTATAIAIYKISNSF